MDCWISDSALPTPTLYLLQNSNLHQLLHPSITPITEEFYGFVGYRIYKAIEIYLGTKNSPSKHRSTVFLPKKEKKMTTSIARTKKSQIIQRGEFRWRQVIGQVETKFVIYACTGQHSTSRWEHMGLKSSLVAALANYLNFDIYECLWVL